MFKKSFLLVSASSLFLLTPDALAVPVDSFDCTFTVRDSDNKEIASNNMWFDMARRTRISTTGFHEAEGKAFFKTTLPNSYSVEVNLKTEYASYAEEGYQRTFGYFSVCSSNICTEPTTDAGLPQPGSGPYSTWGRVAVVNGLPQFDPSEFKTEITAFLGGRKVHIKLACEYKGLIE
ncbi:MAG: hypothetical protein RL189_2952 [Pseudomonadota bacterium]|jgi:hypothetical protein